ncbi:MAG: C-terminal binding protein [Syntrophaceae bacterium]|nr:C-terminal binding protein [Syntrophaceae bacterium]
MFKIVATYFLPEKDLGQEIVSAAGGVLEKRLCKAGPEGDEDELIARCQDADVVLTCIQPFTRRVIESLPKLRSICMFGIGYEEIDLEAATDNGVLVTNMPDYCLNECAEHAMFLLMACRSKFLRIQNAINDGKWDAPIPAYIRQKIQPPIHRLRGQTIGLIGLGNIGKALIPLAKAFGLKILANRRHMVLGFDEELGVEMVGIDRLYKESDFIVVLCRLNDDSYHMVNAEAFDKMKSTAYFINIARGGIVDEKALIKALQEGKIAGAGLDVVDPEPPLPDSPLFAMDNVILTPHMAQYSDEGEYEGWRQPAYEAASIISGKWPREIAIVNPEAKVKYVKKWGEMK